MNKTLLLPLCFFAFISFSGCGDDPILVSLNDDKELGASFHEQILADSDQFPVLAREGNEAAYEYLEQMTDRLLLAEAVRYRTEFDWVLTIIDDDVLNAFVTPGGYIYVYTGLIKFLDTADQLAGVMGHEIAHADRRHTSQNLQREYTVSVLLSLLLGQNTNILTEIVVGLARGASNLSYSREFEREADDYSVRYLKDTKYACDGTAGFFIKLEEQSSGGSIPEFLSTHPLPGNRVRDIQDLASTLSCDITPVSGKVPTYEEFKAMFN
ncbi:MAG: M48 family metallopeptidase [Cyclobacteriaceae bacterium]|nr:M48 family metalloprotease [Cyclobacteriaceae bacterium]MCH8516694.1 M48 family metallopeptidase [Cyclobacteriaceae bacterium]